MYRCTVYVPALDAVVMYTSVSVNRFAYLVNYRLYWCIFLLYQHIHLSHCIDYTKAVKKLPIIKAEHGIHLRALVDIPSDDTGPARKADEEFQLKGPLTYIPRAEIVRHCTSLL